MIVLDWFPRELHPNARVHRMVKAKHTKAYRVAAWATALGEGPELPEQRPIALTVTFNPPDRRRRDAADMLSAIKAGLDGICDAYGLDDYHFQPITIDRQEPVKGGRVTVRFS